MSLLVERKGLSDEQMQDLEGAIQAREESGCEQSGFAVGAILRLMDDTVVPGWNDESTIYTPTLHAEWSARAKMNKNERARGLKRVTVVGWHDDNPTEEPCTPCGMCRHLLSELLGGQDDVEVVCAGVRGKVLVATLRELYPYAFTLP
jgi:cytidine deaminase